MDDNSLVSATRILRGLASSSSRKNYVVTKDEKVREGEPLAGCVVVYTNCDTQQVENESLQPGETFYYHDLVNGVCEYKSYSCPQ